jgi:phospholipase C
VSWLVAPENFSDHPGSAWYGAWYISETLDILTKNPEVWKKTIFIITYDENDGYFDHIPPFVSPNPGKQGTGKTSPGIDARAEFITREQEQSKKASNPSYFRESPIGLGYRVPMVIVSPWSRGGWVNSQVFDHTSSLQFLEQFLEKKTGKRIRETNINSWRRAICGDLTSVFRPYAGEKISFPEPVEKHTFIQGIHQAKFKKTPAGFKRLTQKQIEQINQGETSELMPSQEKGTRSSCALPYELYADGWLVPGRKAFQIHFEAGNKLFGEKAAGSPFTVYSFGKDPGDLMIRSYAVAAGEKVTDEWLPGNDGRYHLQVHGPNGFYREFKGATTDPVLKMQCTHLSQKIQLNLRDNKAIQQHSFEVTDNYSKQRVRYINGIVSIDTTKTFGWYDFNIKISGSELLIRYAGKIENGKTGQTDPAMGLLAD